MKKKANSFRRLFVGTVVCATLAGCGSTDSHNVVSGQVATAPSATAPNAFRVTEPATITLNGDVVDALELEAFDAEGNRLTFGTVSAQNVAGGEHVEGVTHVVLPFTEEMSFPPLPEGTTKVEIDYLRNGGYTLYRATENVEPGQTLLQDPQEQLATASATKWTLKKDEGEKFTLDLAKTVVGEGTTESDFAIKGVCYAPCPINVLGDGAPNIGDFFFDVVKNSQTGNIDFFNWFGLWGKGDMGDGFYARQDLDKIRDLKANTIRVYSMLSRQQNDPDTQPNLPEFPDPEGQHHFTHTQFLDQCWNNGKNPIYVIVGIPTPPDNLYLHLKDNSPAKIKFYDFVLRETIRDLGDHPAVLGFTIQNEINDGADAYPNGQGGQMAADQPETGASNERSDYYWGKVKDHSDYAKEHAPDKLVGICTHDFREIAQYASVYPKGGPSYLEQASNLDFIGINTYQTSSYNDQYTKGWGAITGPARKAVIFSELGFPATTRDGSDPKTIKDTADSRQKTAEFVKRMLPQAYSNAVSLGACYFEFSDEWWKQKENKKTVTVNNRTKEVIAADEWYGGPSAPDFPNGWWDEEGFGLYSIARYPGRTNSDPVMANVNGHDIGPDRRLDRLTERREITSVIKEIFGGL